MQSFKRFSLSCLSWTLVFHVLTGIMVEAGSAEEEEAIYGFWLCILPSLQWLIVVLGNSEFVEHYCNRVLRHHCHCNKQTIMNMQGEVQW